MRDIAELKALSKAIRRDVLNMTYQSGANGGHLGGAFSSAEILAVLYGNIMNVSPDHCSEAGRDRFILSKGHCSIAHYAVLKEMGFITEESMRGFERSGSDFPTHEVMNTAVGIETSSGSLGYGLSIGIGCALEAKRSGKNYQVYVLMGDGECNEGLVWESMMAAARFSLDNLTAIVDVNEQSLDGMTADIMPISDISTAWKSFGWNVIETNGNDVEELLNAFNNRDIRMPNVLIAHTVKSKGLPSAEGKTGWHHVRLSEDQYQMLTAELENAL